LQGACYSTKQEQKPQLQVQVEPLSGALEGVSVLSLHRPEVSNAIGRQLLKELQEAISMVRQERSTRCLLIRSTVPGCFSAGADLKERARMTQAEASEFVTSLRRTFADFEALPMPTIAVLEGYAYGGGAELALSADLRVADEAAIMAFTEARLGIIPGAGGTQRLPRLVGRSAAKELIFTCRKVAGPQALEIGLVDHCMPTGKAYDKALAVAQEIAQCAPLSLRMAKAAITHGLEVDLATGLKVEELCYAQLLPTKDRLEGLKAFAEKRKPVYTGE